MTRRERVYSCIHADTYKYFLPREIVLDTWKRLESKYGRAVTSPGFGVVEIRTPALLLRSTRMLNPITVIRRRACSKEGVASLHQLLRFEVNDHPLPRTHP